MNTTDTVSSYNAILVDTPLGEWPWRRRERRQWHQCQCPPGGVFGPWAALSQKVRPTHGCLLLFLPVRFALSHSLFSSALPLSAPSCCFHWARQTTPGPDSHDLIPVNWLIFQNAEEGRAQGAWVPRSLGSSDRPCPKLGCSDLLPKEEEMQTASLFHQAGP